MNKELFKKTETERKHMKKQAGSGHSKYREESRLGVEMGLKKPKIV